MVLLRHLLGGTEGQRRDTRSWHLKISCYSSTSAASMMGPIPLVHMGGDGAPNSAHPAGESSFIRQDGCLLPLAHLVNSSPEVPRGAEGGAVERALQKILRML